MRVLFLLALLACSKKPVVCTGQADAANGSTPDIFGFGKDTTTISLSGCSDGAQRTIDCRQALSGGYKCTCTVTQPNGHYATLELRTDEALTPANAKDFGRRQCEWKIE